MSDNAIEYLKCRKNIFYFIYNYVKISQVGGSLQMSPDTMHPRMIETIKSTLIYHRCMLMATRQLGKALSLDTPIPLPNGKWACMGELKVGDIILGSDGKPTTITAVTDIMQNHDCYKISFDHAKPIVADADHQWEICHQSKEDSDIITTSKLKELLKQNCEQPYIKVHSSEDNCDILETHPGYLKQTKHVITSVEKVDSVPVKCITVDSSDHLFLCGDYVPTHNSTIAAMMLEWVANFYPGTQIVILNMSKSAAQENLNKIKGIHYHLPEFLKTGLKDNGSYKTFLEYDNGSVIKTFFYSTTTSPDTMARSLTAPILYTDEIAFIPKFSEMWGSAQPVLSKAREQAKLNGYPYFTLITSTPNGTAGTGKFFHEMWGNALPSEQIFQQDSTFEQNADEIIKNPSHNSFIRIRYHWSETRSQEWYQQQCRELNFDKRKINQELDLLFVGGTGCIFDDEFLSALTPTAPSSCISLPTLGKLNIYTDELDSGDFYIIGVDSAKSITGDYCAIEITKYSTLEQVAEYYERVGSITKFAENIMKIVDWVVSIVGKRYILAVENNNVGSAVIEELEKAEKDYISQMYNTNVDKGYGINTNVKTKEKMITFLYDYIVPNPKNIKSIAMIDQLSVIEKKGNGSISAQTGQHDDLFMAYALTAYAKKMTALEIEPRLDPKISKELDKKTANLVKLAVGPSLVKGSFEDMILGMSKIDIQEYNPSQKQDNTIEKNEDMSSIIGDIFGG